jgi:myo-inositol-1(or 4)-monophosphatase
MIDTAIEAARAAGTVLRRHFGTDFAIETKEEQALNLVTVADREAEQAVIDCVRSRYPGHGILGEESGTHAGSSDTVWIIDPLDGTTNFTHAFPIFSVSIAVAVAGELVAGVVYDPLRDELFSAEHGSGAYLNGRRIRVSEAARVENSMLVTGFPYTIRENPDFCYERFILFLKRAQAIRRLGSAALDAAYVAAGRLDGFWEVSLQPWDKAAGDLLVREAGGTVSDFRGAPHDLFLPPFLASNGRIHAEMIDILEEATHLTITM